MNKSQQIIIAIAIPIFFLIAGYGYISSKMEEKEKYFPSLKIGNTELPAGYKTTTEKFAKWNNFDKTWEIWLTVIIIISISEIILFHQEIKK